MIQQSLADKHGLNLTTMQNGRSFIHNVGVYEWPNELGIKVLVSDGDKEGNPLDKGQWMIYVAKNKRWQSFNVHLSMFEDLGIETVIKTITNLI